MKKLTTALMLFAVSSILLASGCVAVVAGAVAGVAYINGEAKRTYLAGMEDCVKGVDAGLKKLEYKITESAGDKLEHKFIAKTAKETTVTIILKAVSDDTTEISVRFGTFGDKKKSNLVHTEFVANINERK